MRGHQGADQRDGENEGEDDQAGDALRAAQEACGPKAPGLGELRCTGFGDGTHLRLVRSFGTRNTTTRSAAMLMAMYKAASTSVMP